MIVTLLTDFGTADYFVGALKGAVLASNPEARVVDITHEVPPYDVEAGAFILRAAFETFPEGTVHVAVVDPGVGSARRAIAVEGRGHTFVGPDNGLFGHVYERTGSLQSLPRSRTRIFSEAKSARPSTGATSSRPWRARSRAACAREELGPEVDDFVRLPSASRSSAAVDGTLAASVIHVDRFGNLRHEHHARRPERSSDRARRAPQSLRARGSTLPPLLRRRRGRVGEPFAVWGSAGLLEVAVFRDSAAQRWARRGSEVEVLLASAGISCTKTKARVRPALTLVSTSRHFAIFNLLRIFKD